MRRGQGNHRDGTFIDGTFTFSKVQKVPVKNGCLSGAYYSVS